MGDTVEHGTLFERLGGEAAMRAAVEKFYARVLADPLLMHFFSGINMPRLKSHQFAFLSQALGGPRQYSGGSMSAAHSGLAIEQRHFDAVAMHLLETLRELGVREGLIAEVGEAVGPLAAQVVNTPARAAVSQAASTTAGPSLRSG